MDPKRKFGVEIEHGNPDGADVVREKVRKKFPKWINTGCDGSGVEVRSPILKGQGGFDTLGEVMEFLTEIGGYVTTADGMHVHHDASDFVPEGFEEPYEDAIWDADTEDYTFVTRGGSKNCAEVAARVHRVLESYAANQAIIDQIVDPYRRKWSEIRPDSLKSWKKNSTIHTGRHNIHYTEEHGTFEFRQHEGTLDPQKAFAWIEFGQHFLNYVKGIRQPTSCAATAELLLKRIGVRAEYRRILTNRPRTTALQTYEQRRREEAARRRQTVPQRTGVPQFVTTPW